VIGVDDFALHRCHRYATVIIDAETHARIDVLPDRTADTPEARLREHPDIEIVCRDGSGTYAEAIRRALPHATQVGDRWHLWHNLCEAAPSEVKAHSTCWATVLNAPIQCAFRARTWASSRGALASHSRNFTRDRGRSTQNYSSAASSHSGRLKVREQDALIGAALSTRNRRPSAPSSVQVSPSSWARSTEADSTSSRASPPPQRQRLTSRNESKTKQLNSCAATMPLTSRTQPAFSWRLDRE
jgi:hypothetical protein